MLLLKIQSWGRLVLGRFAGAWNHIRVVCKSCVCTIQLLVQLRGKDEDDGDDQLTLVGRCLLPPRFLSISMVIKARSAAGWMEAPSYVFSHFRLYVRLVCLPCFFSVLFSCFWFLVLLPLVLEAGCWRLWRRWSMSVLVSVLSSAGLSLHLICSSFHILSPSVLRWRDKDNGGANSGLCVVPLLFSPSLFLCYFLCYSFCLRSWLLFFSVSPAGFFVLLLIPNCLCVCVSRSWGTNASVSLGRNRGEILLLWFVLLCSFSPCCSWPFSVASSVSLTRNMEKICSPLCSLFFFVCSSALCSVIPPCWSFL